MTQPCGQHIYMEMATDVQSNLGTRGTTRPNLRKKCLMCQQFLLTGNVKTFQ